VQEERAGVLAKRGTVARAGREKPDATDLDHDLIEALPDTAHVGTQPGVVLAWRQDVTGTLQRVGASEGCGSAESPDRVFVEGRRLIGDC